jgi:photosystem II stability/assembly factor-like uncharacterized protein
MDISDDGVIYLGTANGIWKSFNNGDNWEFDTILSGNFTVYSLETKLDGIVYAGGNNKIYYSEDFGNSWEKIYNAVILSNIMSIFCSNDIILIGTWYGILKSTDNGTSWDHVLNLNSGAESIECIIGNQSNGEYYAGAVPYLSLVNGGLYKSEDFGETWEHIQNTYHFGITDISINASEKFICSTIWDPDWIFGGIYEFDPIGNTWQCLKYGERGSAIVVNKLDDYYAGIDNELSNGGCRVSYDNGVTWETINYGLSNSNIRELKITPDGYLFCVSSYPAKVFRSIEPTFTGISQYSSLTNNMIPFPNPFSEKTGLYINSDKNCQFKLYDIYGNLINSNVIQLSGKQAERINIKMNKLFEGIYYYIIKDKTIIISQGKLLYIN